ncbi:aminotransferase class IV [Alkaliphilus transvaalensis]|uniref:aminotransferase class IV n=1 Tax=Alkaliphilus transvaalensis TaxID=114628 RepID=UPI000478FC4C|nr:aminotransferase class IV [Alkaliphilus transvaalensis]
MGNRTLNNDAKLNYFLKDGKILKTSDFQLEATNGSSIYEVIRVMNGVPLFLEEHLERLNTSIKLSGETYRADVHLLKTQVQQLIELNNTPDQNIKIIINNLTSDLPNLYLFFISSSYPTVSQYQEGVKSILYSDVRHNPNIKTIVQSQRDRINTTISKHEAYEAILVNENNEITEGSRSNIFIVKENSLYTASASDVLIGITRSRVINLCKNLEIIVNEKKISTELLKGADGIFLTGTSPKVLPISQIDESKYGSANNPIILKLMKAYDELILQYINGYQQ